MFFFCSSRRRQTGGALVTGVRTCALPIYRRRLPLARLPAGLKGRCAMDLSYGPEYEMFHEEVRGFIAANRHLAPTNAGRAARPSKEGVAWQKLLIQHGYTARTKIGRAHV